MFAVALIFWSFVQIFAICEFGQRITGRFYEIKNEIFNWDWYTFPMDVQKIFPIIVIGTETPVELCGFGNIVCTRSSFKNVRDFSCLFIHECRF